MSTTEQTTQPGPASSTLLGRAVAGATGTTTPGRSGSTLLRNLIIAVIAILIIVGLTYLLPSFRNFQLANVMKYLCVLAGLTMLVGVNGQLSLGHGAIMAVGAYSAGFTQNFLAERFVNPPPPDAVGFGAVETVQGWTWFASMAVGVIAALLGGLLIGLAAARLRGPYLAGATLAVAVLPPSIATSIDAFNGDQGIRVSLPPNGLAGVMENDQWQVTIAAVFACLVMMLLANLINSRVGRSFRAVRDDEVSAQLSGIHVARTQIVAFVVSAGTAGLAGTLVTFLTGNAQPGTYDLTLSLYLVLAIVIGGLGSLTGAVWGALFLVVLPDLTSDVPGLVSASPDVAQKLVGSLPLAIFGLALILVTILAPGGIQTLIRRLGFWLRGLRKRPASE